jgi:uncharacterized damage-inducible protein DinB
MPKTISESLLPEFDHEMANTRRTLERVPDDRGDYRPHERSMSLGRLAGHIATNPQWATLAVTLDGYDMAPVGGAAFGSYEMTTREALLALFDEKMAEARAHVAGCDDATMLKMWTFRKGGHTVMSMPKIAVLRSFAMNHMIHHRGQLSVYLRLNDVKVPALYGPSADET